MEMQRKPSLILGGLMGALLTAPLIAILYLADRALGLPFAPFDLFDWFGRIVPGELITAVIDIMVDTIIALDLGTVDSTAKIAEQLMALGMMLGVGAVVGAVTYLVLNRTRNADPMVTGAVIGLALGLVFMLIFNQVNLTATADPNLSRIWLILAFAVWGVALGWTHSTLNSFNEAGDKAKVEAEAAGATTAASAHVTPIDRRKFLVGVGGATATLTVVGAGLSLLVEPAEDAVGPQDVASTSPDPEATAQAPVDPSVATTGDGQPLPNNGATLVAAPGTRPEYTPLDDHYRIDISARPPVIDGATWRLEIEGLVAEPISMTLEDIQSYPTVDQFITMSCISNRIGGDLISTTRWTGAPLKNIIADWGVQEEGMYLKITSADGFDEYVALVDIRTDERIMLAWAWDGQPLKRKHGFPLRIYIPDHYGMKQPKWITNMEVVSGWDEGYWVRRGWSETAIVNTTSVVDTVSAEGAYEQDEQVMIPVGGIAYAGAKGISRVEVRIDENDWVEAEIREPLSDLTWVIWRYDWPFEDGNHTFAVRCYDARGRLQEVESRGTRPDGATGVHSMRTSVDLPETLVQA